MSDEIDQPTSREVLLLLNAHVKSCEVWSKIHVGFMGATFSAVMVFAGYTYVQSQDLARDLAKARMENATALATLPDRTAKRLTGN